MQSSTIRYFYTSNVGKFFFETKVSLALRYDEMTIGDVVTRHLLIKNTTAIMCEYKIDIKNFKAKDVPDRVDRSLKAALKKGVRVGLLRQTPHLADPCSITLPKAIEEYNAAVLKNDNGVAFTVEPAEGTLGPFAEVMISITCYSDMWGHYTDTLVCQVGQLPIVNLPIKAEITSGFPISYQIMGALGISEPILRFGSKIDGTSTIHRNVQINNTGPCDINLFWKAYDYDSDEKRLVCLDMFSGSPLGAENLLNDVMELASAEVTARTEMESVLDSMCGEESARERENGEENPLDFLALQVLPYTGIPSKYFSIEPGKFQQDTWIPPRNFASI